MSEYNIVLAGVGGQGTLLAAQILGVAAVMEGLNVRVSEIHGMAQRGGAVTSNVRIGDSVYSPMVLEGQADALLGFEPLETIRSLKYASDKTFVVMSDRKIPPTELAARDEKYPEISEVLEKVHVFTKKVLVVEAERLAREAGSILTQNVVLIGALAATVRLPVRTDSLLQAMRELVPEKYVDVNVRAFRLGYDAAKA